MTKLDWEKEKDRQRFIQECMEDKPKQDDEYLLKNIGKIKITSSKKALQCKKDGSAYPKNFEEVVCTFCETVVKASFYRSHVKNECSKTLLNVNNQECLKCGSIVNKQEYEKHLIDSCSKNPNNRVCFFCKAIVKSLDYEKHLKVCKEVKVCHYCGLKVKVSQYGYHLDDICKQNNQKRKHK